jgi:hypothetical protein
MPSAKAAKVPGTLRRAVVVPSAKAAKVPGTLRRAVGQGLTWN